MELTDDIKKITIKKIRKLSKLAESLYDVRVRPKIHFSVESAGVKPSVAGLARQINNVQEVFFNKYYLANFTERFLYRTVTHEMTHLIIYRLQDKGIISDNIDPHGDDFRRIMESLGSTDTSAKNDYDITVVPGYRRYICTHCKKMYSVRDHQHRKFLANPFWVKCECNSQLIEAE